MLEAAAFAAVGQAALIVGALLVWRFHSLTRAAVVGSLMAFGAGAVISAVSTDLVAVAYDEAGGGVTALGIGIGGLGYFLIIALLERSGASEKPQSTLEEAVEEESDGEVAAASRKHSRWLAASKIGARNSASSPLRFDRRACAATCVVAAHALMSDAGFGCF